MRDPPFPGVGDMATRKSNLRLSAKDLVSIAGDLGTQARVFNDNEVRQLLRAAVERAGTQVAFAKRHGLDRTHLNQVLKEKSRISHVGAEVPRTLQSIHDRSGRKSGQNDPSTLPPSLLH